VNLADTNGCLHPQETSELVAAAVQALADLPEVSLGVHLHNDLGLATAGTLAAVEAGARHVEVTVGGIGTRSGNAPLEEVVFGLEVFRERLGLEHHIRLDQLEATSSLLNRLTGVSLHPNKPVLGKCAFQEARAPEIRRALPARLQELMREESIGRAPDTLFTDREMSRAGFEQQLEILGVRLESVNLDKLYGLFRAQVGRKKTVLMSELREMVQEAQSDQPGAYEMLSFSVATGSNAMPLGGVELRKGEILLLQSSHGSGPVDALCRAVDKAAGLKPRLLLYSVDSVTEGKDARAAVTVSLAYMGRRFHGHSGSTDVIEASLRAYLDAINSIERYRREAPEEEFYIDGEQLWWE
jgi:2-isopropylmalate synthase